MVSDLGWAGLGFWDGLGCFSLLDRAGNLVGLRLASGFGWVVFWAGLCFWPSLLWASLCWDSVLGWASLLGWASGMPRLGF